MTVRRISNGGEVENTDEYLIKQSEAFARYMSTWNGKRIENALSDYGVWRVRGEDPNCDLGGPHIEPELGYFEGVLIDVVRYAVMLPGFWAWGGGGRFTQETPPGVKRIDQLSSKEYAAKLARLTQLEEELAGLKKELGKR